MESIKSKIIQFLVTKTDVPVTVSLLFVSYNRAYARLRSRSIFFKREPRSTNRVENVDITRRLRIMIFSPVSN